MREDIAKLRSFLLTGVGHTEVGINSICVLMDSCISSLVRWNSGLTSGKYTAAVSSGLLHFGCMFWENCPRNGESCGKLHL